MEKINEFVNELKETMNYAKETEIISKKYGENLWCIEIKGIYVLWLETIKVLTKWKILNLRSDMNGYYEIIIGFK